MRARRSLLVLLAVVACKRSRDGSDTTRGAGPGIVAGARIAAPAEGDGSEWRMPAGDWANSRYSALHEITRENVRGLRVAWTFSTGTLRGHEGQPLVVDNTMYVVTPYPNVAYALDLTQPGAPLRWKYRPNTAQAAVGIACCDVVNRGAAWADGKIIYNLLDGHTVALDAKDGRELWKTKLGDVNLGETMTMAPIVVGNRVLVGNSGGEMGVRGWIAALDVGSGKVVWKAYSTGPDADVKIGPRFKPFYPGERGTDLGATSWPGRAWSIGGGAVWGWLSYDPDLKLVYHGTSNPGPWNQDQRPGDNKWTAAILARDVATGEVRWAYQITPHDLWDYDGVNENILVDLPMARGETRKVLVHFDRNGFAYTIDRATGEVLVAKPYVLVNWSEGFDTATGRHRRAPAKMTRQGVNVTDICPSLEGGKDQQPAAFSPRTGWFYVPTNNLCMDYEGREVAYIAGTPYIGASAPEKLGPGGHGGELMAWDATAGRKLWGVKEPFPVWSGVLATAGDVVFYGTLDGWLKALDARTGELLWRFKTGSGIIGNPIAYTGPDGHEYIAVYSGIGGDMGLLIAGDVAAHAPYDVRERGTTLPDLAKFTSNGGMLFVFSLPDDTGSTGH